MTEKDKEWHKIGITLTGCLGICQCQRKLKSFVNVLIRIYNKYKNNTKNWTEEEYIILSFLDSRGLITHGTNCEYPIILDNDFWKYVNLIKDNEFLEDN